jgi:hypothetical protein
MALSFFYMALVPMLELLGFRLTDQAVFAGLIRLVSKVQWGRFAVQPETSLLRVKIWPVAGGRFVRRASRAGQIFQRDRSSRCCGRPGRTRPWKRGGSTLSRPR